MTPTWKSALQKAREPRSGSPTRGMEQPPGHGSDVVEEIKGGFGLCRAESAGAEEETEVDVDLPRGAVGDAVVVQPVATGSSIAFDEVRRDR